MEPAACQIYLSLHCYNGQLRKIGEAAFLGGTFGLLCKTCKWGLEETTEELAKTCWRVCSYASTVVMRRPFAISFWFFRICLRFWQKKNKYSLREEVRCVRPASTIFCSKNFAFCDMLVPSALLTIKQNELHFKETYKRPKTRRLALAVRTSSVVHTMQWMVIHNVENNFVLSIRHVEAATKNLCMFKKLSRCEFRIEHLLNFLKICVCLRNWAGARS